MASSQDNKEGGRQVLIMELLSTWHKYPKQWEQKDQNLQKGLANLANYVVFSGWKYIYDFSLLNPVQWKGYAAEVNHSQGHSPARETAT